MGGHLGSFALYLIMSAKYYMAILILASGGEALKAHRKALSQTLDHYEQKSEPLGEDAENDVTESLGEDDETDVTDKKGKSVLENESVAGSDVSDKTKKEEKKGSK